MKRLNVKHRVVIGLLGLTISVVMLAFFLGIVPDSAIAVRQGRTALAEAIAVHTTSAVLSTDFQYLKNDFELLVNRNPDLLSLGLRRHDGAVLVTTPGMPIVRQAIERERSNGQLTRVPMPIWSAAEMGQLELRFEALDPGRFIGLTQHPMLRMIGFMGLLCYVGFYFYLGKVLRQLDTSGPFRDGFARPWTHWLAAFWCWITKSRRCLANKSFATMLGKASTIFSTRLQPSPDGIEKGSKMSHPTDPPCRH